MSRVDPTGRMTGDAVAGDGARSSRGARPGQRDRNERPRTEGWQPRESRSNGYQPRDERPQPQRSEGGWQPRETRTERPGSDSGWQPREGRAIRVSRGTGPSADNRAARRAPLQPARSPWQQQRTPSADASAYARDDRRDRPSSPERASRGPRQEVPNDGQPRRYASDGVIDWQPRAPRSGESGPPGARRSYGAPAGRSGGPAGGHRGSRPSSSARPSSSGFGRQR